MILYERLEAQPYPTLIPRLTTLLHDMAAESVVFHNHPIVDECIADFVEAAAHSPDAFIEYAIDTEAEGSPTVGIIAGYAAPYFFNRDNFAYTELWFVHPAYRKGRIAINLLKAFEQWAIQEKGAQEIVLGINTGVNIDRTQRLLEHFNYRYVGGFFRK